MPWHIEDDNPDCDGYAVVKDDDGEIAGCHQTRDGAEAQMAALYANEDEMSKGVDIAVVDIKSTSGKDGYDITLSKPRTDRDDEVIDAGALKWRIGGRMPIDVDHGMTVLTTVGSGIPVQDGEELKLSDFRFARTQMAQDVKSLVDDGHISKMSVAFMAADREKDEKDGKIHVRDAELLNAAIVAIPSLREADIVLAAKSAFANIGALNLAKGRELVQHNRAAKSLVVTDEFEDAVEAVVGPPDETAAAPCPTCGQIPAATDPEDTAAADEAAADTPPADVLLAQAQAAIAAAELTLLP